MSQKFYEDWKKTDEAKRAISAWVKDPEGILAGNGHRDGIYEIKYVNESQKLSISAYIGQVGQNQTAPAYVAQDLEQRVLQHLKRWLGGDYFEYWTGLDQNDTDWQIELHLLSEETDHSNRLKKESEYIAEKRPFLQDTADGAFKLYPTKYGYRRNDIAIFPWRGQRRAAFLHRVEEVKKSRKKL